MTEGYYNSDHLENFSDIGKAAPELWEKFAAWYESVFKEGSLSKREKTLIALAVAHAVQCPYCIDTYTQECLRCGCDMSQLTEAVHIAAAIRGGASMIHGMQMRQMAAELSIGEE